MRATGALIEALQALALDLAQAGIPAPNLAAALVRLRDADDDDREWIREFSEELRTESEARIGRHS